MERIPFNRPQLVGLEHRYIDEALSSGKLSGNGAFAQRCAAWLEQHTGAARALMTPSCTAALEMAALLLDAEPGDEVIVPSFTFVSSANAFVARGLVPVFVDVRPDTLCIDVDGVAAAVGPRTRAVVAVHYGGVACDMEPLLDLGIPVIEDAAHALPASWRGRPLGSFGTMATFSFHETKNVQCGEGGALVVNDPDLVARAEVLQEKGTDRTRFFRGEVDKYTWVDVGSSYLLSEVATAFLWAQLEAIDEVTARRMRVWEAYDEAFAELDVPRPVVPDGAQHAAHLYYLLLADRAERDAFIAALDERGVHAVFHYQPLHSSPAGVRYGRTSGPLPVTDGVSERLVRLPLWAGLTDADVERVIDAVSRAGGRAGVRR